MDLKIIDIKDKDLFTKAWSLYENSFPSIEKRSLLEQETLMNNKIYKPLAFIEDDMIIAILFYWDFKPYSYIEHFAVNDKLRGMSYGSKILENFLQDKKDVILEIELISDEISHKRLKFYEKFDFKINEFKHYQVPFRKNQKDLELLLLSYKRKLSFDEYKKLYSQMKESLSF
ncbi:GNAT family N-acetyltransferase [Malaciobacter sp. WC5094]